jgi:hypothetical protein
MLLQVKGAALLQGVFAGLTLGVKKRYNHGIKPPARSVCKNGRPSELIGED